jgi:hypothetical protein
MSPKLPRIDLRVFTVFLVVALPVLAVGVILVLGSGQARLRDSYGRHLAEVARHTVAAVDSLRLSPHRGRLESCSRPGGSAGGC